MIQYLESADDGGGDGAAAARARDALRDAYDFSTGAQLTRYKRVRGRAYEDDDGQRAAMMSMVNEHDLPFELGALPRAEPCAPGVYHT